MGFEEDNAGTIFILFIIGFLFALTALFYWFFGYGNIFYAPMYDESHQACDAFYGDHKFASYKNLGTGTKIKCDDELIDVNCYRLKTHRSIGTFGERLGKNRILSCFWE